MGCINCSNIVRFAMAEGLPKPPESALACELAVLNHLPLQIDWERWKQGPGATSQ